MHLALFIHRHMPHNRGRGGRCARLCRALGESHSQDAPQLRPASPPLAGRASGWFTSLIHQRSSLHLLISSGVTSQVREGPSAGPRLNSPHLLSCLEKPSHFLCHGLSVLAGLAMRSESGLVSTSRPQCIAAPHSNKITTWIMVTMANAFSCTISAHTHLQRENSLPFFAARRAIAGHRDQRKSGH